MNYSSLWSLQSVLSGRFFIEFVHQVLTSVLGSNSLIAYVLSCLIFVDTVGVGVTTL